MKRLVHRVSPSTVIASIALFVSLGGVGYAAATIGSAQIKNNSVRSKDLRNNDVRSADIRTGNVGSSDIRNNGVTGTDVLESSLGKVPSASSADSAGSANTANSANSANNAGNADKLGGADASDYRRYSGAVPSGKTITGAWGLHHNNTAAADPVFTTVQFPVPAPSHVAFNQINFGAGTAGASDADASCTGNVGNPTAPAGKVCIYVGSQNNNANSKGGFEYGGSPNNRWGFSINASAAGGDVDARGTWAYTAP